MSNYIQEVPIERDKNVNSNDFTKTPLELNEEEKERRAKKNYFPMQIKQVLMLVY